MEGSMASSSQGASISGVQSNGLHRNNDSNIFKAFICPVTHEIMHDPVILVASNQTVQRTSASKWFAFGNSRCPVTGVSLPNSNMVSNKALQTAMRECDLGISALFPRAFVCPVNNSIMRDPILIVGSEQTISRSAFNSWRTSTSCRFCPVTNKRLPYSSVCENIALRKALEEWEEEHGTAPHALYNANYPQSSVEMGVSPVRPKTTRNQEVSKPSKKLSLFHLCLIISYILLILVAVVAVGTSSITKTKAGLDGTKLTPKQQLLFAAQKGHSQEIERLISNDSSIDVQDEKGKSPIFLATANGHVETIDLLIKLGANIDLPTLTGETPLLRAVRLDNLDLVSTLTSGGAVVSRVSRGGITPLSLAAYHGLVEVCELLLAEGANTETVDYSGWTPLVWAVYENHPDVVEILVEVGAKTDVRVTAKQNNVPQLSTPLHIASREGFIEVAKVLLASEADLKHMTDVMGETPKEVACKSCASSKILLDLLA